MCVCVYIYIYIYVGLKLFCLKILSHLGRHIFMGSTFKFLSRVFLSIQISILPNTLNYHFPSYNLSHNLFSSTFHLHQTEFIYLYIQIIVIMDSVYYEYKSNKSCNLCLIPSNEVLVIK